MNLHSDKYRCNHCNKKYSSVSSLWNHNNKFHKNDIILDNPIIIPNHTLIIPGKNYDCRICQRKFNNFQNRWKHQKICKAKNDELVKSKEELYKIKQEIEKTKTELLKNTTINKQINNITINAFSKEDVTLLKIP